jgi:hypothetical protein
MFIAELRKLYGCRRDHNRIGFNVAYLRWPRHMSITLLDPMMKKAFTKKMEDTIIKLTDGGYDKFIHNLYIEEVDQIRRLIDFMNSVEPDLQQLDAFATYFDEYDRRRGTSLLTTFPELGETYRIGKEEYLKRMGWA